MLPAGERDWRMAIPVRFKQHRRYVMKHPSFRQTPIRTEGDPGRTEALVLSSQTAGLRGSSSAASSLVGLHTVDFVWLWNSGWRWRSTARNINQPEVSTTG